MVPKTSSAVIARDAQEHADQISAVVAGRHDAPFNFLGVHRRGKYRLVRTFQPGVRDVTLIDGHGKTLNTLVRVDDDGFFVGLMPPRKRRYRFRLTSFDEHTWECEDTYRFDPVLGPLDLHLLHEGSDQQVYRKLGAHVRVMDKIDGVAFAVWAPNASRVSVVGQFNGWDGRRHPMRRHPGSGFWELFVPHLQPGDHYKYELLDAGGGLLPLKADPFGQRHEAPPGNASIVYASQFAWSDDAWQAQRDTARQMASPISIYEVHLGSWKHHPDGSPLSYRELAETLIPYVQGLGFTHIELLPITEFPYDGSWGYQPTGLFAPTHRFGPPDDLRFFVNACHAAGIAVVVDWVPAHFPRDEHGLARFDGTALYEHDDPRKGAHADWGTLIYNFGRREVMNYLIGSALYWIKEFHIDALRVDAVASMLYLDYSREEGDWLPNQYGGNENLEAVEFLKLLNIQVHAAGGMTFAEESTAWPGVSHPVDAGGLGFTFKWNMGWMNDTLSYVSEDPVHRKHHHNKMTFSPMYAFSENFVLPLSHDEVVHGKRSLLGRMPGDEFQRFANLRAYLANMFAHPGKKLLFMGAELAPYEEWNHAAALPWSLLDYPVHAGVQALVRDLNRHYAQIRALHELDHDGNGFDWIDCHNHDESVLSWLRYDRDGRFLICITNFTPVVRQPFRLGVPASGNYRVILNTDEAKYAGSGVNASCYIAHETPCHGRTWSIDLDLPPLATLYLVADNEAT